ncbi:hypothetical protein FB451DRAFT_1568413 [Mycena latifolia]|nr:hypothetical protein FB451DRAFT_1568413 [Mycena latifolia]
MSHRNSGTLSQGSISLAGSVMRAPGEQDTLGVQLARAAERHEQDLRWLKEKYTADAAKAQADRARVVRLLNEKLHATMAEATAADAARARLTKELHRLRARQTQLENENSALRTKLDELSTLKTALDSKETEVAHLKDENNALKGKIERLHINIAKDQESEAARTQRAKDENGLLLKTAQDALNGNKRILQALANLHQLRQWDAWDLEDAHMREAQARFEASFMTGISGAQAQYEQLNHRYTDLKDALHTQRAILFEFNDKAKDLPATLLQLSTEARKEGETTSRKRYQEERRIFEKSIAKQTEQAIALKEENTSLKKAPSLVKAKLAGTSQTTVAPSGKRKASAADSSAPEPKVRRV